MKQEEFGSRARFEPYRNFVRQFIQRFESELQPHLEQTMELVLEKVCSMREDDFKEFLQTYQYVRQQLAPDRIEQGIGELWRMLILIQLAYPEWRFVDHRDYANIEILEEKLILIIYSVNQDTMPEIILNLVERNLNSKMRSFFKALGFPSCIIMENANRELGDDPKENLCQHCREGKERARLDLIVEDFGHIRNRGVMSGIEPNRIGDGSVNIVCSDCLRKVRSSVDMSEILKRLREVI